MDPLLPENLITTKHASELSGYTSDYLSRLIRSGKITGKKIGHSWLVDSASLESFLKQQKDHKLDRARELAHARVKEYRAHHTIAHRVRKNVTRGVSAAEQLLAPAEARSQAFAISLACAVVISAATVARAESVQWIADSSARVAQDAVSGFSATFGDVPVHIADAFTRVQTQMLASPSRVAARTGQASAEAAAPALIAPDLSFLQIPTRCTDESCPRVARRTANEYPITVRAADAIALDLRPLASSVAALVASPASMRQALLNGYEALGSFAYDRINGSFSAYRSLLEEAGSASFAFAIDARDTLRTTPRAIGLIGAAIADVSHAAIQADVAAAYGLAAAAPVSAHATVALLGAVGDTLASATAEVPQLATSLFLRATEAPAHIGPALAQTIFGAEYGAAERFIAHTTAVSEGYLAVLNSAGQGLYETQTGARRALATTNIALAKMAGVAARAYESVSEGGLAIAHSLATIPSVAAVIEAAQPSLTAGEQVALTTYQTISGLFNSVTTNLAFLFSPAPTIVLPQTIPTPTKTVVVVASSSPARAPSYVYPTYTTVVQGISSATLDQSLTSLRGDILATVAGMIKPVATQTVTNMETIRYVAMVQDLTGLIVRNGDFRGGTFADGASISATTGSFGTLTLSSPLVVASGGTGTSSPSGILYGDGGATSSLSTVTIGSGLTFVGGTLSSTGGGGGGTGTVGT